MGGTTRENIITTGEFMKANGEMESSMVKEKSYILMAQL
jgi:hypothetical protein